MGFSIPEAAPLGQGVWKLNTSILDDDEFTELIDRFWGRWWQVQTAYPTQAKLLIALRRPRGNLPQVIS